LYKQIRALTPFYALFDLGKRAVSDKRGKPGTYPERWYVPTTACVCRDYA